MKYPEKNRIVQGILSTAPNSGSGAFAIPMKRTGKAAATPSTLELPAGYRPPAPEPEIYALMVLATEGHGWDHVSVSIPGEKRSPTWEEMCIVKGIFFDAEDVVWQYHPAESQYVNNARYCLHMWRKQGFEMPTPPPELIGIKSLGTLD